MYTLIELGHMVEKTLYTKVRAINRYGLVNTMLKLAAQNQVMLASSVWAKTTVATAENTGDTKKYVRLIGSQSQSLDPARHGAGLKVQSRGSGEPKPDLCSENR